MKIALNTVVQLEFQATLDGAPVDGTHKPKLILVGKERDLPPQLEALLIGREAGERFTATVPDAFGPRDEKRVVMVAAADLPVQNPGVGDRFTAEDANGAALEARVVSVDGDAVTVDLNHPRAGKPLTYTVRVHAVRAADAHELAHGHAHGDGGVTHDHHD
jgi:FKBP-type peptidyl-prolyl cis-trans isomerase SlyD